MSKELLKALQNVRDLAIQEFEWNRKGTVIYWLLTAAISAGLNCGIEQEIKFAKKWNKAA